MSTLGNVLNTGLQGVIAQQNALNVTSQNIANVDTPGYHRQRPLFETITGGGVRVAGAERLNDKFIDARHRESTAAYIAYQTLSTNLQTVEKTMGTVNSGVTLSLRNFFASLQSLSTDPGSMPYRETMRSRTSQLGDAFNSLSAEIQTIRKQVDDQVVLGVDQINSLTSRIADLNYKIGGTYNAANRVEAVNSDFNRLLDERDALIDELSTFMSVRVVEDERGRITVYGNDAVLVEHSFQHKLIAEPNYDNDGMHDVYIAHVDGSPSNLKLKSAESDGKLGALIESRDGVMGQVLNQLDQLASQIITQMNAQHQQGLGLAGEAHDLFKGVTSASLLSTNTGGVVIDGVARITDINAFSFSNYEIRFTSPTQYDVINTDTGATVLANGAYTSGQPISFGGMEITLEDGPSGGPLVGDVVSVTNRVKGAAARMSLSDDVAADIRAIAAGVTSAPGDNTNVNAMISLGQSNTMGQPPSATFEGFLDTIRVQLGIQVKRADDEALNQAAINEQIVAMRDSVSGVNDDEEAVFLIQYQRAFQASSKVISATDELLQTLIQMVG